MAEETKGNDAGDLSKDAKFMDLYSRQIGAYGLETMAKLVTMRVLIIGLKGVGMELAKNIILAGPKAVTLLDNDLGEPKHMGANFFMKDEYLGKPIAASMAPELRPLNNGVLVKAVEELNDELLTSHDIVVATEGTRKQLVAWDNTCRNNKVEVTDGAGHKKSVAKPVAFISVVTMGAFGAVFSDFGPNFTIRDANGEEPSVRIIEKISNDEDGIVTLMPASEGGKAANVTDDEHAGWVTFSEVRGMFANDEETHAKYGLNINKTKRFRAKPVFRKYKDPKTGRERSRFDRFAVKIGDTRCFSPYAGGGIMTQVKVPITKNYKPLSATLLNPGNFLFTDGAKWDRGPQLHLALQGVYAFQAETGSLPEPNNAEHAEAVVAKVKELNAAAKLINSSCGADTAVAVEEVDEDVVRNVALFADTELQPVCTFFGGVVAQECVKLAGKFTPLDQWMHMDWFEILPEERPTDVAPLNCRYDHQIAVFGKAFQDKLGASSTFLVGCGAIGCEMLKNFAMIGIGCGGGAVHCTDNDIIEISNLNRQFLFRSHNVGKQKSEASSAAAKAMNPGLNVKPYTKLVMTSTEDFFNDDFWNSLSFVTNALDNIKARQYVDRRCVFFEKALLESGTLGTKCNSQVIVPHLTQSYEDGPKDADEEEAIPMCTLRNFPSLIDHCIEWARAQFTDRFVQPATDAAKFIADRDGWIKDVRKEIEHATNNASAIAGVLPRLRALTAILAVVEGCTFEKIIRMASAMFHDCFRDRILDLILKFPADAKRKEDGQPFWGGHKRFPTAATLDLDDDTHFQFVAAASNILACMFGLRAGPEEDPVPATHEWRSRALYKQVLSTAEPPPFKRSTSTHETHDNETKQAGDSEVEEFERLLTALAATEVGEHHLEPADFEKDHDWNFHIDFIHATSNLRARNYSIQEATRHKTKMIAGKIIPAIATATAASSGLVMLEMYKLVAGKDKIESYRCSSNNLGVNAFVMSEPAPATKAVPYYSDMHMDDVIPLPEGFTKWDKTHLDGDCTLEEFLAAFKEKTGVEVSELYHSCTNDEDAAYSGLFLYPCEDSAREAEFLAMKLVDVIKAVYVGAEILEGRKYIQLQVTGTDDDMSVYEVPKLVVKIQ